MGVDVPPSIKLCPYLELKKNKLNNTVLKIRVSQESEEELK